MDETAEKIVEFTGDRMEELRKAAEKFMEDVTSHFKDMTVEVKEWRFAVGKTEDGHTVDAAVKLLLKNKK